MAGVVGGVFNAVSFEPVFVVCLVIYSIHSNSRQSLQLGVALGLAILASITTSVDEKSAAHGGYPSDISSDADAYKGIAAGYWFIFALVALLSVTVLLCYKQEANLRPQDSDHNDIQMEAKPEEDALPLDRIRAVKVALPLSA